MRLVGVTAIFDIKVYGSFVKVLAIHAPPQQI
jgi:hypothetical protein